MEHGSGGQSNSQAKGVRQLLGERQRLPLSVQGLVRIAKKPQPLGCKAPADHPGILGIEEGQGAVLSRVVEGNTLCGLLANRDKLSQPAEGLPQRSVSLQKESRVLQALCEAEELLPQLTC